MEDDIYIDFSGIYYKMSLELLSSLLEASNDTTVKIQYTLIIEHDNLRKELYNVLTQFTMNNEMNNQIELIDDKIIFTLVCKCSDIERITNRKIYIIKIDKNNNNTPVQLAAVDKFRELFLYGYKEMIVEEVTISIIYN